MLKNYFFSALLILFLLPNVTKAQIVFDNGPIFNSVGTGAGGANESVLYTTTFGMGTIGFGQQLSALNRMADDFVITSTTPIDSIVLYAYQTNSGIVSTINHVNFRIWNGPPDSVGATIVFGDTTTNRLTSTSFTNTYRITETTVGNTSRPIMRNLCATPGLTLSPGTYWIDWQTGGTTASGPWQPARVPAGMSITGNGKQRTNGVWNFALDGGTGTPAQGFPFILYGPVASTLTSTPLTFPTVCVGSNNIQSTTITGAGLTGTSVVVGPLASFGFSTNPLGPFDPTVTLSYVGSTLSSLVYVQYLPLTAGSNNGDIIILGGGATDTISVIANANSSPTVTASISAPIICLGSSTTFTGGGAATYTWSDGTNTPTDAVAFMPPASGTSTYTVTGVDANMCSATSSVSLTVNPNIPPTVTASVSASPICQGTSAIFTGGGASTYTWSDGTNTPTDATAFTPLVGGTSNYTVTGTDASMCSATASVSLTVLAGTAPTAIGDTICGPGIANLTATAPGNTILWYTAASGGSSLAQGANFNPSITTDSTFYVEGNVVLSSSSVSYYTGMADNSAGGGQQSSTNYNIFDVLAPSITIDSVTIYPGSTGAQTVNIQLSNSVGTILQSIPVAINPTVAGAALQIPVGMAIPSGTGYQIGQSASSISLFRNNIGVAYPYTVPGVVSITNSSAGSTFYYFFYNWKISTGSNTYCASTRAPVFAKVNALPIVTTAVTPSSACIGSTTIFAGGGASTYTWTNGTNTPTDGVAFTHSIGGTSIYTVIGTDANMCSATSTIAVTVNNPIPINSIFATPSSICAGLGTSLNATLSGSSISYCQPSYSNGTLYGDYVSSVSIPTTTLNNTSVGAASPYYTLFPASGTTTASLVAGNTYSINLVAGTYTINDLAAWIDYNQNGTLNDASEKLGETDNLGASPATTTFTFTVPLTAYNGTTRLRVRDVDHGGTNDMDPCAAQSTFGETEDYIITITGGVEPATYSWSPNLNMIDSTTLNPSVTTLSASTVYTITATSANTCTSTSSVSVTVNQPATFNAPTTILTSCPTNEGGSVLVSASSASTFAISPSGPTQPTPGIFASMVGGTNYMVTLTDGNLCTNTTIISATSASNGELANATATNASSTAGNSCAIITQNDNTTMNYFGASCDDLIATIADASGGNVLGSVNACVTVLPTVPTYNGQPYLPRTYDITPANQGPATITLYFTQDDFDDYNTAAGSFPQIPAVQGVGTATFCISQVPGGFLPGASGATTIVHTVTATWNAALSRWEVVLPVTSFSGFYCHACNPLNSALPASITNFKGTKTETTDLLTWTTTSELNNASFNILYSTDGKNYNRLTSVPSKATSGNSNVVLNYKAENTTPKLGHNYYKLEQVDIDGKSMINTQVVDLMWGTNGSTISVYPNPTSNELNIDVFTTKAENSTIKVLDMSGRILKEVQTKLQTGANSIQLSIGEFATGIYTIHILENNKITQVSKVEKK